MYLEAEPLYAVIPRRVTGYISATLVFYHNPNLPEPVNSLRAAPGPFFYCSEPILIAISLDAPALSLYEPILVIQGKTVGPGWLGGLRYLEMRDQLRTKVLVVLYRCRIQQEALWT